VLPLSYNVDFGYISLYEVIGMEAAYVFRRALCTVHDGTRMTGRNKYVATIPTTSNNDM